MGAKVSVGSCRFHEVEADTMIGGTLRHSLIASRAFAALIARVDNSRFEVTRGDLKALVNGTDRYPDLMVFPATEDVDGDTAPEPVVVVEVVSPASRVIDRFDKNVDYAATPSISHYVMLSDSRRSVVVCSRVSENWVSVELEQTGSVCLPAIDVELPLDDIYRGLRFVNDPR